MLHVEVGSAAGGGVVREGALKVHTEVEMKKYQLMSCTCAHSAPHSLRALN